MEGTASELAERRAEQAGFEFVDERVEISS